jgi:hypothetical protein
LQATYVTNGVEYAIAGAKPGDQVHPAIALGPNGGFLVWEDNVTSSTGLGISAQRLDANFSASLSSFKVNSSTVNDHERPKVAVLNDGRAAFVWQGGKLGYQHIYARFLSSSNTWLTDDILVNSSTNYSQLGPVTAALPNGNLVVIWSSLSQYNSSSLQDVYGQIFSPEGQKIGNEFLVNQFVNYNQRTPSVAALSTGGFVVAWVSEQQRAQGAPSPQVILPEQLPLPSVDVYARLYSSAGLPVNNEFLVNTSSNVCANPNVTAGPGGAFLIAWSQKDTVGTEQQLGHLRADLLQFCSRRRRQSRQYPNLWRSICAPAQLQRNRLPRCLDQPRSGQVHGRSVRSSSSPPTAQPMAASFR